MAKKTRRKLGLMNPEAWKQLKEMTEADYKPMKIRRETGRSTTTLYKVHLSNSFEDYQRISREMVENYPSTKKKDQELLSHELIPVVKRTYQKRTFAKLPEEVAPVSPKPLKSNPITIKKKLLKEEPKSHEILFHMQEDEVVVKTLGPKLDRIIELLEHISTQKKRFGLF